MAITVRSASPEVMAMQEWEFPKRKRGRPKGSKNKPKAPPAAIKRASPNSAGIPQGPPPPASLPKPAPPQPQACQPQPAPSAAQAVQPALAANGEWWETRILSATLLNRFGEFIYRTALRELGNYSWPPNWNAEFRAVELRFLCEKIERDL